ncbi:NUDIX domain-containing protein [Methylocella sp.]|uniref:NUDIX domain-containing protein n=1 Tax=Methylocella sp. TaxID=1978226 RepID=UPI003783C2BF
MTQRLRILGRRLISKGYGALERLTLAYRRLDGREQTMERELYDTGDGAAILLYDASRGMVALVRQFRLPAYVKDGRESLIEVCAGRLEGASAEARIVAEAEEETGFRVRNPRRLFEGYTSPGGFCEKLTYFAAEYSPADRIGAGGGLEAEGEDIEILEIPFAEALAMIERGEIVDTKTILLLHYARLAGLLDCAAASAA